MSRIWIFMILIACPVMAFGQVSGAKSSMLGQVSAVGSPGTVPYQPAVPPPSTTAYGGGAWGYGGAAQTAAGAALQGTAQVISAAGDYNLATSAAAVNATHAQSNAMRNQVQGVQTFYDMRDLGSVERGRERGPRATAEELARRARAAAPRALTANQMDPASGVLYWPAALQNAGFEAQRIALDEYAVRWLKYGGLDYDDKAHVRENVNTMYVTLKSQIASMPPQDYVEGRAFLESLLYATTRAVL